MIECNVFAQVDMRVGRVVEATDFPEAKKLAYRLKIDFGSEIGRKETSAQLTKNYTKESLLGKLVVGVVNLPAKKIGNFRSEVLILGLPDQTGECILLSADKYIEPGERVY